MQPGVVHTVRSSFMFALKQFFRSTPSAWAVFYLKMLEGPTWEPHCDLSRALSRESAHARNRSRIQRYKEVRPARNALFLFDSSRHGGEALSVRHRESFFPSLSRTRSMPLEKTTLRQRGVRHQSDNGPVRVASMVQGQHAPRNGTHRTHVGLTFFL